MLTSRNCGKYLSKSWTKERELAMENSDDTDQTWLELTDAQIGGEYNPDTYKIDNSPVDPETSSHKIDIRRRPENG